MSNCYNCVIVLRTKYGPPYSILHSFNANQAAMFKAQKIVKYWDRTPELETANQ